MAFGTGSMARSVESFASAAKTTKSLASTGRARSAPSLVPPDFFPNSTQGSTWYSGGSSQASASKRSCWKPLAGAWREFDTFDGFSRLRTNVDEGNAFQRGTIPNYQREAIVRMQGVLAHELQWLYYQVKKDKSHPARKQVHNILPNIDVVEPMRDGGTSRFHFWRDLRPPFSVLDVQRADQGKTGEPEDALVGRGWGTSSPEGELYLVTYECGIDYVGERKWGVQSDAGTFNNRLHGTAQLRIPNEFPFKRPCVMVHWGQPVLNFVPKPSDANESMGVPPDQWNPLAEFLGIRADSPKMAQVRVLSREANRKAAARKLGSKASDVSKLLLGPHPSVAKMAHIERTISSGGDSANAKLKERRVFTAAGGFVRYHG